MSADSFTDFVLEQLQDLERIHCRAMFGGHGLYSDEHFFAIVYEGGLYMKTNAQTRPRYEAAGMHAFRPNPRQCLKNYYSVPADVLEDPCQLIEWALDAIDTQ